MTKIEHIVFVLAKHSDEKGEFYSLTSAELFAIRRYLRANSHKHRECRNWLRYYAGFIPSDRPKKSPQDVCVTLDDYPDFLRFSAFLRQILALNGIVVPA